MANKTMSVCFQQKKVKEELLNLIYKLYFSNYLINSCLKSIMLTTLIKKQCETFMTMER